MHLPAIRKPWWSALLFASLALAPFGVDAAIVPAGEEIVLADTGTSQFEATRAGDRFAVVVAVDDGVGLPRLELRYLDPLSSSASGPVEVAADGAAPTLAAFADGSLVVVWTENYSKWYARLFDATGAPTTDPLTLPIDSSTKARVATGSGGNWVVVGGLYLEDTKSWELRALRFSGGMALSPEPVFVSDQFGRELRVAMNAGDEFLVSWAESHDYEDCGDECWYDDGYGIVQGRSFDAQAEATSDAHGLADFHHDEQGEGGNVLIDDGSEGFVAAWMDLHEMDYLAPGYLAFRHLDSTGGGEAKTRVVDEVSPETAAYVASVGLGAGQAVLATVRSRTEGSQLPFRIELYSTPLDAGPVESVVIDDSDRTTSDDQVSIAVNESGAVLLVWARFEYPVISYSVLARSYVVAPTFACGDANHDAESTAMDALAALRAAVDVGFCAPSLCDTNADESITATDAASILRHAVGIDVEMLCPSTGDPVSPPFPEDWP